MLTMTSTAVVPAGTNPVAEVLKHIPTSTAHQARLQLYQPTRRPQWMERVITTPWGTATVRGKIGQVHADIIEAICRHAEDHRTVAATGHLQILVDPYRVRVSVGGGTAYSKDTLWRMLTELREVSITLEVPSQGIKVLGGILDRVEESPATRINHLTKKPRQLWRVTLDPAFAAMLRDDLQLYYDPAPLAKIETGVAQAIARHILTHRDQPTGGWLIDNLIKAVGADGDSVTMRHRRREIRACAESLKTVGLIVEDDRIFREA
ncbi:ABC transporter ATPase [Burkholderia ubonensis]|uniref:ABC transporter ATPase n=1 Tax=Burkholderia ubonensis TaxID=101571 RepID=UPI000A5B2C6B|nr:ABC transporter ATPase [Burkholderia ubonensis]